ncbi:MAG: hypothetical protein EZS28_047220, partial [Streblomastix strix]
MKELIESMLDPISSKRPTTKNILENESIKICLKIQEDKEKIPSSIGPIPPVAIFDQPNKVHQDESKIIKLCDKGSFIAFNPKISNGIVRFEGKQIQV